MQLSTPENMVYKEMGDHMEVDDGRASQLVDAGVAVVIGSTPDVDTSEPLKTPETVEGKTEEKVEETTEETQPAEASKPKKERRQRVKRA